MLENKNIICISSIDWDFIWQGHQEIMSSFAKNGNQVLFIENTGIRPPSLKDIPRIRKRIINWLRSTKGFRKEAENLYIFSPLFLPFPYSRIAAWINKYLMMKVLKNWIHAMQFYNPIVWTFLPTGLALDVIHNVNPQALVYYYIADFDRLAKNYKKLKKAEEELMRESDVIFVQGEYFRDRCLKFNKNVFIFPFGVNTDVFESFNKDKNHPIPKDISGLPRPIVGYVGGIHRHIDFDLIKEIAVTYPDWTLVMIGPIQAVIDEIKDLENVHLLGQKDFSELPAYINRFDVCIVPYLLNKYTETVYPTKINEYHIMGKPVVSTCLPEVIKCDEEKHVSIAKDRQDFVRKIKTALDADNPRLIEARISSARKDSWSTRIEEMSGKIEKVMRDKSEEIPLRWRERFVGLYRKSKRELVKLVFSLAFFWAVIFYTPVVWYLAEPLRFSQQPEPVDAIVVFAGGVGESGQAGQGYEERLNYAIQLYKEGFAKNMIFSSGARSTFPEPYIMKSLAISLGIPEGSIILEDKASSTYENVEFTVRVLNEKGWKKIILISSPYHMLRSSLVFKRVGSIIRVIYSPVPDNQFYAHRDFKVIGKQITLRQIKAIIHEYTAIFYYWLIGHI